MKSVTPLYKMLRALDDYWYDIRVIQGNHTYNLDKLKSVKVYQSLASGNGLSVGGTNATECNLVITEESDNWARMAQFTVQFKVCVGENSSEWVTVGTFYTDERSDDNYGNLTIKGFDGMLLTEQYWSDKIPSSLLPASYPITARAFASMVQSAGLCTFENISTLDNTVEFIGLDTGSTLRDKLKDIASAHGGNWQITSAGSLRLTKFESPERALAIAGIAVSGIAIVGTSDMSQVPVSRYPSLGTSLKTIDTSPPLPRVSGVTLETEAGDTASAGSDASYVLKATCNFSGTDGLPELCYGRIAGYSYVPFQINGAFLDPIIEIGDIVVADGNGYQIMEIDWNFCKQPTANLGAPYDEEVDHEYTIVNPETKTYRKGLQALGETEEKLNSSIEQTARDITLAVSREYETKTDATGKLNTAKNYADAQIKISADNITSTVSASQKQYDLENYSVALFGYGAPSTEQYPPSSHNNQYYLSQTDGALYRSNGSAWSKVKNLTLITTNQQSQISQNAEDITARVTQNGGSNTANSFAWQLTSDGHRWYANGAQSPVVSITGSGLAVRGEINATSGYIGNGSNGFSIGSTSIYNGMTSLTDTEHNGIYLGTNGIALGKGAFKVTSSGQITATSGTIGGFTMNSSSLYNGKNTLSADTTAGVFLGTGGIALGNGTANHTFKVTSAGAMTVKYGMNSLNDTENNGVYIGTDGIAFGKGAFKVTSSGQVTATNLDLKGGSIKLGGTENAPVFSVTSQGAVTASNLSLTGGSISIKDGNGNVVFSASSSGVTVNGNGTFTGNVYAKNIIASQTNSTYGTFNGGGITYGSINGGLNQSGGAIGQLSVGACQSLGYADAYNLATLRDSTYPTRFQANGLYSHWTFVTDGIDFTHFYSIKDHTHDFEEVTSGANKGKIKILKADVTGADHFFSIADTTKYKTDVLASRAVLYCNATNYNDYTDGWECNYVSLGSSYLYTPTGESFQYGRIDLRNSYGNSLKTIRVKIPLSGGGISTVEGITTTSSNYTTFDYGVERAASAMYFDGTYSYGRAKITLEDGTEKILRFRTNGTVSCTKGEFASGYYVSDYVTLKELKYMNGEWYLMVHAEANGAATQNVTVNIDAIVDEAYRLGGGGGGGHDTPITLRCTSKDTGSGIATTWTFQIRSTTDYWFTAGNDYTFYY